MKLRQVRRRVHARFGLDQAPDWWLNSMVGDDGEKPVPAYLSRFKRRWLESGGAFRGVHPVVQK